MMLPGSASRAIVLEQCVCIDGHQVIGNGNMSFAVSNNGSRDRVSLNFIMDIGDSESKPKASLRGSLILVRQPPLRDLALLIRKQSAVPFHNDVKLGCQIKSAVSSQMAKRVGRQLTIRLE